MKIYQMLGSLTVGDAIGNDCIAIKHVIEDMGIKTAIYAPDVSPKIKEPGVHQLGAGHGHSGLILQRDTVACILTVEIESAILCLTVFVSNLDMSLVGIFYSIGDKVCEYLKNAFFVNIGN